MNLPRNGTCISYITQTERLPYRLPALPVYLFTGKAVRR